MRLELKHREGPALKPAELLRGIFHLSDEDMDRVTVLKRREVLDLQES